MLFSSLFIQYLSKGNELELENSYPQTKKLKLLKGDAEIVIRFQGASINYDMTVESGDDIVDKAQQSINRAGANTHANGALVTDLEMLKGHGRQSGGAEQMSAKNVLYVWMQVFLSFIVLLIIFV